MPYANTDLKNWHNWTDPDFFVPERQRESRLIPLFLRQILPAHLLRTQLTLTGWCLIVISLGLGTAAYTTGSNILFLVLSLLLSTLILSGVLSWVNFRKLEWNLIAPQHLRANQIGVAEIQITNNKSIFPSMSICFQLKSETISNNKNLYMQQTLHAGESCTLEWTFVPRQRGCFTMTLSGVQSRFPFGFLRKTAGSDLQSTVLVWPARIEYLFNAPSSGLYSSARISHKHPGHGDDLLNISRYKQGDSPRLIHWKATARMRRLMVRKLSDERENGYHIRIDPDTLLWDEELFELLCSLAYSLADDLFHLGKLESVIISGSDPAQIHTIHDLHTFFDRLSLLKRQDETTRSFFTTRSKQIIFRPYGSNCIAIYVEENYAGKVND